MSANLRYAARAAALLLLAATACSVGRREVPPIDDLPPAFGGGGAAALPEKWWIVFGDPVLDSLVEEGLRGSPDLAAWADRLDQARALARKAGAGRIPEVSLSGEASRSALWPEDGPEVYADDYSLGASLSYEIDLWGRVRSGRLAAFLGARSAGEDLRAAALSLSGSIASVRYESAEADEQVRLLTNQVETNEAMLDLVDLRFRRGQTGAPDVLTQRRATESARGDLRVAEGRAATLRHQLAVLLGRPPREEIASGGALVDPPPLPETGVPVDLLRRRPDLRAARLDAAAANAEFAAAVADRFPKVSLRASGSTGGTETADLFADWFGNLAGNLALPLLDGGSRAAEADRRDGAAREAFHAYRSAVLTALREVEDALVLEARQAEYLESLRLQLDLADALVLRTRDSYLNGQADYLRVLEAMTSQQTLQRAVLTARRTLIQYRIRLCLALGGGWTPEERAGGASLSGERTES